MLFLKKIPLVLVLIVVTIHVTLASPQWGVAASADAANDIDRTSKSSQDAQTAAAGPRLPGTGYGMYPYPYYPNYNPYSYGGYGGYGGYYPQRTYSIGGLGYQGLPWYGFYG